MSCLSSFQKLRARLEAAVVGQPVLIDRLLTGLLADGHLLVEGPPGLAKTRTIRQLAALLDCDFHRIQFTPDLLPADITGTEVFRPADGSFRFEPGPLFHHLVLADEINRAPAKVQSALLEAMAERQITVGKATYVLPEPFLVMATQNPIEHEGTHPLPEAQLDRFLMHVRVDYPDAGAERDIVRLARAEAAAALEHPASERGSACEGNRLTRDEVLAARREVLGVFLSDGIENYLLEIVQATRDPSRWGDDLAGSVRYGASPRAAIALDRCARARAWLAGRDFVMPEDVTNLVPDILRHRVLLAFEAEAAGRTPDTLISALLARIPLP